MNCSSINAFWSFCSLLCIRNWVQVFGKKHDWLTSQILHVGLSNSRGYDTPSSSCGEISSHPFKCINAHPCEFLGISLDQPKARCSSTAASNASISNGSAGLHRGLCTSCHHWHCTRRSAKVSGTCQVDRLVLGLATSSGWVVRTATPTRLVATSTTGSVKRVPMSHFANDTVSKVNWSKISKEFQGHR